MQAIKAIWKNGQILPTEPIDWPEGSELLVEPLPTTEKIGMDESEWRDDPESIAAWIAAVDKLEPMVWQEGEREAFEEYRQKIRQFNIDAVRKQMEDMPGDGL